MKKFVKKLGALALAAGLVFGASFPTAQAAKEFEGQKVKVLASCSRKSEKR